MVLQKHVQRLSRSTSRDAQRRRGERRVGQSWRAHDRRPWRRAELAHRRCAV